LFSVGVEYLSALRLFFFVGVEYLSALRLVAFLIFYNNIIIPQ
jgi:hypothetical protein